LIDIDVHTGPILDIDVHTGPVLKAKPTRMSAGPVFIRPHRASA
jgi:hypothetical protein